MLPAPAKRVLSIAIPAIGEAYLQSLLGVVDAWFIARIGLVAVNAVGLTNIYSLTYIGVFTAVSTAVSVFLSRAVGANDAKRGRSAVWHGYVIALVLSLILSAASVLFAVPLLHIMGAYGELEATALPYFCVVLGISPLIALFTTQSAAFRATGDTKTPLKVALEMNAVHVVLDYILIFGVGWISGFGLAGAAWAMVLARLYAFLRLWWKSRSVGAICLRKEDFTWRPSVLVEMVTFAVPAAAERLSMRLGQVIYFGMIVRMGINVYATHTIAGTLTVFASTVGAGFATAAIVTIGQAIGGKDISAVQAYRRWSYILSAISMTVITAAICIFSPWIGLLFSDNQQVIQLLIIVLAIDTISQPFLASTLVDTSAIQAGGNSKYPMIVTTIGIWGIRTLGVYFFAWYQGWGLPAVWASIAADNVLRAVLFARYRRRRRAVGSM
ncbi:MATE family efflux transporter [Paenibacillus sp. WQ 127069]|uniref:Probable multidrug resistance protein NorM n=1 Tax=Paenibacillus baimaensis TaxID=2982185 RepID=A0ABT2UI17_9BACL|nr:MATE family efflux transporter [Paenibacillus sp. WQ 127069]MCU6794279.1 MATE family efflux transporter [Paenibacillus sp. WQ 127069]